MVNESRRTDSDPGTIVVVLAVVVGEAQEAGSVYEGPSSSGLRSTGSGAGKQR